MIISHFKFIFLALSFVFTHGVFENNVDSLTSSNKSSSESTIDSVIATSKQLLGKAYRSKSPSGNLLDCSGFIKYIWSVQNINVSGSSQAIASQVAKIELKDVKKGDFLFFTGRNKAIKTVGHLSMVIERTDSTFKMIHSCNRGVVIDDFPRSYYDERILFAGRLKDISDSSELSVNTNSLPPSESISIIGVGDMMIGTNFPSNKYLPPNDGKDIFAPVKHILQDADLTFGNLEGVILTDKGTVKRCSNPAVCYAFKSPDHYINYYKDAGFDVVSLANNHSGDFGVIGRKNTVKKLEEVKINYAGLESCPYSIFEKDGIKYGFYAVSPNRGTVRINNYASHKKTIAYLDSLVDVVIVSFHGGAEGSKYTNITKKTEIFLGENRGNPYEFARVAIDAGADIIFGHGPHVTRAMDIYKNRFIAYSLGNFATYARFSLTGVKGLAPIVKVNVTKEGKFIDAQITATKQTGEGGPQLDPENRVIKEIQRLTGKNVPNSSIIITDDGKILEKK
tara:strand:+ start:1176 stop:2699 length:1524 start_codon:yes stop_codon:yes gene_type:complete